MEAMKQVNKETHNRLTNISSAFNSAKVTEVNADGTYDVEIKCSGHSIKRVTSNDVSEFKVGDFVTVGFIGGDRQKPQIIGFSVYHG